MGNEKELTFARKIDNTFEKDVGAVLHDRLKKRVKKRKYWLGGWWDKYDYKVSRQSLLPYTSMASPLILDDRYILQTPCALKVRIVIATWMQYKFIWNVFRTYLELYIIA